MTYIYISEVSDNHCATVFTRFFDFFDFLISEAAMVGVFEHGVFDGPVTVRSSRQLKRVENKMFELMDHSVAFYILPDNHRCHTENLFQLVRQNVCNNKKALFVSPNMANEIFILDAILQSAGYIGFSYTCPGCNIYLNI